MLGVIVREVVEVTGGGSSFTWAIIPASIAAVASAVSALIVRRSDRRIVKDVKPAIEDTQVTVHEVNAAVNHAEDRPGEPDG